MTRLSVALVGAGAMGGALLKGWLDAGAIDTPNSSVFELKANGALEALAASEGFALNPPIAEAIADALVFAVKPQGFAAAAAPFATVAASAIVLSVMAGVSVAAIAQALGNPARIVRAMPNLAATVGAGVTALHADAALSAADRGTVDRLIAATGKTVWLGAEAEIDIATAVSGSGPAYYFLLTEALAEAGAALGLPPEAASALARATAVGAGALLDADPRPPGRMREAVTSPGGTSAAALAVLDGDDKALRRLINDAVAAAARRARELSR